MRSRTLGGSLLFFTNAGDRFPNAELTPPLLSLLTPNTSHAFIPHDADDHTGVVFPTGLQLVHHPNGPPSLLLGYGKGDDRIMMLTLGHQAVQEYLQPVGGRDAKQYRFCSVGRDIPIVVMQEEP